ncbi:hypothetical protein Psfp_03885 [Pelotomaculum sp. FP]|uniref:hypothetical protein n=1 Tax=Pelotomaculum sp. FP TaxID=261474 RepID=UPI001065E483|nr:hypothetical protein [Pelotomaculum sp. FP]TEB11756.1 hypothetical protein Psfp_03885 [Pelotomaculum sp. FP]
MNKKYRKIIEERYPWLLKGDYCLTLSDDVDSLVSCAILHKVFGYPIHYFYDFNGLYCNGLPFLCPEPIGVDLTLVRGKTICNHVSRISDMDSYNPEAANLNLIDGITAQNFTRKYAGSTAIFLFSLLRDQFKIKENDLFWAILLCIDSYFKGYKPEFRDRQQYYLCSALEMPEVFELQKKYSLSDFEKVQNKLKMKGKIRIENGQLNIYKDHFRQLLDHIGLELHKIENDFYQIEQYEKVIVPYKNVPTIEKSNLSTFACTYAVSGIGTKYIN